MNRALESKSRRARKSTKGKLDAKKRKKEGEEEPESFTVACYLERVARSHFHSPRVTARGRAVSSLSS